MGFSIKVLQRCLDRELLSSILAFCEVGSLFAFNSKPGFTSDLNSK